MGTLVIEPQVRPQAKTLGQQTTSKQPAVIRIDGGAQVAPGAPNVAPAETRAYQVGSAAGRIAQLVIPLGFAVFGFVGPPRGASVFMFVWYALCLLSIWTILKRPYILHVGRDWAEFVSLIQRRRVHADEIHGIIRQERPSGSLDHLDIQLSGGSVTVWTGHEEIFNALTRINPAAWVTTEEYDPD